MKEHKPEEPQITATFLYPPSGAEAPSAADTASAGEVTVAVVTDGRPHALPIQHNFNLSAQDLERRLPDVLFEAEDADFYLLKPSIAKRSPNSIVIDLNPESAFGSWKPTKFAVKLKRNTK